MLLRVASKSTIVHSYSVNVKHHFRGNSEPGPRQKIHASDFAPKFCEFYLKIQAEASDTKMDGTTSRPWPAKAYRQPWSVAARQALYPWELAMGIVRNMLFLRKLSALTGAVIIIWAGTAHAAGYVNDRKQWLSMKPEARAAYAQGMNDSQNFIYADDTLAEAMVKRGRTKCLLDLKTGADTIAENITFMYKNPDYMSLPPSAMYIITMAKICKVYIDIERSNFGLGPS